MHNGIPNFASGVSNPFGKVFPSCISPAVSSNPPRRCVPIMLVGSRPEALRVGLSAQLRGSWGMPLPIIPAFRKQRQVAWPIK